MQSERSICKVYTNEDLIHTLLLLFREEYLEEDKELATKCLYSLENTTYKTIIVYNQGCLSNKELYLFLNNFNLNFYIMGEAINVGIPRARQYCFEYIWQNYPHATYISELHVDMLFAPHWEDALISYLEMHEEPMISCGIVDRDGEMKLINRVVGKMPTCLPECINFLESLRCEEVVHGFTHPCIHKNFILKQVGGYDIKFLKGKLAFEDDSLLLGYYYYYGTKVNWYPKVNYQSVVYHATCMQRFTLDNDSNINFNGLLKQYGAMGLKHLSQLHTNSWSIGFFQQHFNNQ